MLHTVRFLFWSWAHRRAEALWHWIYNRKLKPITPKSSLIPENQMFFCGHREATEDEKKSGIHYVGIYRQLH
jgi:hypothetical protein